MTKIPRAVEVRALGPFRIFVRFDDGMEGTFDLAAVHGEFTGIFEPLKDPEEFARVFVEEDFGVLAWPSGVELDPIVVHFWATGEPAWVADELGA